MKVCVCVCMCVCLFVCVMLARKQKDLTFFSFILWQLVVNQNLKPYFAFSGNHGYDDTLENRSVS